MKQTLYRLTGRCLYFWVRSKSLSPELVPKTDKPNNVVYVLEHRSWANVMVLEHECKRLGLPPPLQRLPKPFRAWHRLYTVAPRLPFKLWLEKKSKRSRMLRGMLEVLRDNPDTDICFVPVSIFWGRPVAKQKSWIRMLFAESWGLAGRTRKFFSILFHGRDTLVKFNSSQNYRCFFQEPCHNDEVIDQVQNHLSQQLNEARTATLGPDISHRRTLIREILQTPAVQTAIERRACEDNRSVYRASLQARRYLLEIVANCTTITIRLLQRVLTAFWNRYYSGICVDHLSGIKQLSLSHELVYVPCHRSHVDYLLLSYVIHEQGLAIPYIAAGRNLNIPVIGFILRSGGAFFIRRTFKGNELYAKILFEYLARLLAMGMPVEYFIEGGRSRTGRLLKPKPGMLSMTIRGYLKYRKKPIAFVPVYIGYEKMIEGKSYVAEMSGEKKQKESLWQSIKAIANIRGGHGSVFANFGEPVYLQEILDQAQPQWRQQPYDDEQRAPWLKSAVQICGRRILTHVNAAAAVNASNLTAVALLATATGHMDEQELQQTLACYANLIDALRRRHHSRITITTEDPGEQIARALNLGLVNRRRHELGDIIHIRRKKYRLLNYYRNNVIHLFVLPSLVACCFLNKHSQNLHTIVKLVRLVYPVLGEEYFMPWDESSLPEIVDGILNDFVEHGLLSVHRGVYSRPAAGSETFPILDHLSKVILPVLELYFMIIVLLLRNAAEKTATENLIRLCELTSERIFLIHHNRYPDFFDKRLIGNFIESLMQLGYVQAKDGLLQYHPSLTQVDRDLYLLISPKMRATMSNLHMTTESGGSGKNSNAGDDSVSH